MSFASDGVQMASGVERNFERFECLWGQRGMMANKEACSLGVADVTHRTSNTGLDKVVEVAAAANEADGCYRERDIQPSLTPTTTRATTAPSTRRPTILMMRLRPRHHRALSYLDSSSANW